MKHLLAALLLTSCAAFGGGEDGLDLNRVADKVALYRADIEALAPLATPETQEKLGAFVVSVQRVEAALRTAGTVGSVAGVKDAARAALAIAKTLEFPPDSEARFVIALAEIALNHVEAWELEEVPMPVPLDGAEDGPR